MLEALNREQREAVLCTDGPLLLIAGAGSGKTRVLTTRVAWLIREHGVPPSRILAFTFTNKAAREMRERVARFVPEAAGQVWLATFHSTGARILRQHAHRMGWPNDFTIYDQDDSRSLLKQILEEQKADPKQLSPRGTSAAISRLKNQAISPEQAVGIAITPPDRKVAEIYGLYERRLRASGAMDFDDLIGRTVELLETVPEVQAALGDRFRYVLVDEFQDTNGLQLVMTKALSAVHGNLFAVGDDDQSIYSWRGATVENMLRFEDYFPGARVMRLEQNYRSTSLILRAANQVIAHNRQRRGKNLWSEQPEGDKIELHVVGDEMEEGAAVAVRVQGLLAEGDVARRDVAILYRTNAQSRALEDALRYAQLPYQIVGGVRFYERREVRDVLAYLKLVCNPLDPVSFQRVVNVPRRGIGDKTVERLVEAARARDISPLQLCSDRAVLHEVCGARAAAKVGEFAALLSTLRKLAESVDAPAVVEQLLAATGYRRWLVDDDAVTAQERLDNVEELVNAAHAFAAETDRGRLVDFLEQVTLLSEVDQLDAAGDSVTLMTMHNAKGLEFPVVFVAGCEEGLLPHASSVDDAQVEEERRLFYVALTRAKRRVVLTVARTRRRFGVLEAMLESRFLHEIPADCLDEATLRARERATVAAAPFQSVWAAAGDDEVVSTGMFGVETFRRSQARQRAGRSLSQRAAEGGTHGFAAHELNQEEVHFAPGMRVRHELLGEGTVEQVEGSGELTKLTVRFGEAGRKRLLARYASLSIVDGS